MDVNVLKQIMMKRAGMTGGGQGAAPTAASTSQPIAQPNAAAGQSQPSNLPPGSMSEQPLAQLDKSQPGEAMTIIKGLVNRLRALPPSA